MWVFNHQRNKTDVARLTNERDTFEQLYLAEKESHASTRRVLDAELVAHRADQQQLQEAETRIATLEEANSELGLENDELKARNTQLQADLKTAKSHKKKSATATTIVAQS